MRRMTAVLTAVAAVLVPVTTAGAARAAPAPRATVMIVLDTSGSMRGAWGTAARTTAEAYLDALPADVAAGLVTFGSGARSDATLSVPPGVDRTRLTAALDTNWSATTSPVYDAVVLAAETVGRLPGPRRVLILSDCDDLSSSLTLDDMAERLARHRVTADMLVLEPNGTSRCDRPVRASGGRLLTPDDVMSRAAELAAAPAPLPPPSSLRVALALGTVFCTLLGLGVIAFRRISGTSRRSSWHVTLEPYRLIQAARPAEEPLDEGRSPVLRTFLRLGDRILSWRGRHERLADELALAGLPLRPAEWLLLRVGVSAGFGTLLAGLGLSFLGALFGLAIGWFAGRQFLRLRISRRRSAFTDQLPDALQLVVSALQAGFSLQQALAAVVREETQPIAGEIARALARTRLGLSVEDALEAAAERMRSTDFAWAVLAIRIQRQVGGNLAELLTTTVRTMRDRCQLRRHVRALSAEGRLSAYVLIGLPITLALWMFMSRRAYLEPLYTTPIGWLLLIVGVGSMSTGWFWMTRLVKVEV
jgi:tight adherence protein B